MKLREIAHSRTGDKGNTSNSSVIAYESKYYAHLRRHVTSEAVKRHFGELIKGAVTRFELPEISALNFVMEGTLGGGVTRSLSMDAHGKTLSSALLDLEIPDLPASSSQPAARPAAAEATSGPNGLKSTQETQ